MLRDLISTGEVAMQSRRSFFAACGRLAASLACFPLLMFTASDSLGQVPRGPLLRERLLAGLRVRTKADRAFIDRVVLLVNRGILPVKLVDSTFFWARAKAVKRTSRARSPMVYFRPGLTARARALRIRI